MNVTIERAFLILLSIAQTVWMVSWVVGRWTREQEISNVELARRLEALERKPDAILLERDIAAAHKRLDQAGHLMSNLATDLQGFDSRMRAMAEEWLRESRDDRRLLWAALDKHKPRRPDTP